MVTQTFTWRGKAHDVAITGTFNNWGAPVAMQRAVDDPNVFQVALPLPPGDHQYKFIVDSSWTYVTEEGKTGKTPLVREKLEGGRRRRGGER